MTSDVGREGQVTFRPMTPAEFDTWKEHSIASYASDVAEATGQLPEIALTKARTQFPMLLPDGIDTDGTWLMVILDHEGAEVGTIWIGPDSANPDVAFIWDIEIREARRGCGLGRAAMLAAEQLVADSGHSEIRLSVFGFNDGARHLYETLGYRVVSTSMTKMLGS